MNQPPFALGHIHLLGLRMQALLQTNGEYDFQVL